MRFTNSVLLGCAAIAIAFGCSDAAKEATTGNGSTTGFSKIYADSFSVSCKNCHYAGAPGANSNLDMSSASTAYTGLMERVTSPGSPSTCTNQFRVVSGQPSKSYLLGMLSGTYLASNFNGESGCAHPPTHKDGINLSQTELDAIVQWIQSGAAR